MSVPIVQRPDGSFKADPLDLVVVKHLLERLGFEEELVYTRLVHPELPVEITVFYNGEIVVRDDPDRVATTALVEMGKSS